MKLKRFLKSSIKKIYRRIPFKKSLLIIVRKTKLADSKFYKYLTFKGTFSVYIDSKTFLAHNTHGGIENEIFWKGLGNTWEKEVLWIWKQLVSQSEVIFDIGSNTGMYSLIAKTINPLATIIAFEPSVKTFRTLQKNCRINNYDIKAEQLAVSNGSGSQIFYDVFEDNQYSASLSSDKLKNFIWYKKSINEYTVQTIRLSDYIERNNITKVDLIKIDVELHEPEVLEGLGEYLQRFKPNMIIEILTQDIAVKVNAILKNTSYLIYQLASLNEVTRVESLFQAEEENKCNFLLTTRKIEDILINPMNVRVSTLHS